MEKISSHGFASALVLGWAGFFIAHSLFAGSWPEAWLSRHYPRIAPAYRLVYTLVSFGWVLALLGIERRWETPLIWNPFEGPWVWGAVALDLAAALVFLGSLFRYDLLHFLGVKQLLERYVDPPDRLVTTGPSRYVRHPLYTSAFVLIWVRPLEVDQLISTALVTVYLLLGTFLEEQRLVQRFGEDYRRYMRMTGRFWPRLRRRMRYGGPRE